MRIPLLFCAFVSALASGPVLAAPPSEGTLYSNPEEAPVWACKTRSGMKQLVDSLKNSDLDDVIATAKRADCTIAALHGVTVGESIDFEIVQTKMGTEHIWAFWVRTSAGPFLILYEEPVAPHALGDPV